jgi:hypothetical protein
MKIDATTLMTALPLQVAAATPDVLVPDTRGGARGAARRAAAAVLPELSGMPPELRDWLVRLRLLDGVPFAYLVADTALLPEESIRWFYVDRRWTDAIVQGALSVGTVNSDDRTQLTAEYPGVRAALDRAERNQRRRRGQLSLDGPAGPVSGFILRSRAVSGWPALHVRAFNVDPAEGDEAQFEEGDERRMRLLRLERLAPAVLLCLFDGIPTVVHVEEPRQGVQFGFDERRVEGQLRPTLKPRDATTFEDLPVPPVDVPFRAGASGVVDIQALERALKKHPKTGAGDGLTSAEYALQLVRFPFRQVFGDTSQTPVPIVFRPTVSYERMMQLFTVGVQP